MGNEIAYLMPTEYKIFLGKGALGRCPLTTPARGPAPWTPANTSLTDCPSHSSKWNDAHAYVYAIFDDSQGKRATRGNLKLVEA